MTNTESVGEPPVVPGWRFKLGVALFALSLLGPPIFIPLVASLGFSAAMTTSISGGILVGAEVLLVAAAAVMGKSGYAYIKNRTFGILKQCGPPRHVGRARYNIGLVVFAVPILFGWLVPYVGQLIHGYEGNEITFALVGDLLLLVSLFILGGDFWDKLRALFIHDVKAVFAERGPSAI
jgi:hypothetical protein